MFDQLTHISSESYGKEQHHGNLCINVGGTILKGIMLNKIYPVHIVLYLISSRNF
jgi:hypothetical protein